MNSFYTSTNTRTPTTPTPSLPDTLSTTHPTTTRLTVRVLPPRSPPPIHISTPLPPRPLLPMVMLHHSVFTTSLPTLMPLLLLLASVMVIPSPAPTAASTPSSSSSPVVSLVGRRVVGVLAGAAGVLPRSPPVLVVLVLEYA